MENCRSIVVPIWNDHSGRCLAGPIIEFFGGNGVDPGGLHQNSKKVDKKDACKDLWQNGEKPVVFGLWIKPHTNGYHEFVLLFVPILLQMDCLTADCGSAATVGGVKTTPQKTRFRSVNN